MSQPCQNFKTCGGYAFDRKAKLCGRCWKIKIDMIRMKHPLKNIDFDGRNINLEFEK